MFTNGEKLKDARLKQGKSIAELSQQTRISPQFLEAIEANDLESLPGDFFRKSFVKQYAEALDVELEEVQPEAKLEFRSVGGAQDGQQYREGPMFRGSVHEQPDLPPLPVYSGQRPFPVRQIFLSVGLLIGVLAVCAVAYTIWEDYDASRNGEGSFAQNTEPPPIEAASIPSSSSAPSSGASASQGPAPETSGEKTAESPALAGSEVQPMAPQTTPVAETNADVHGAGDRELRLSASAATWVQAREGDRTVFVGVISPGQTKVLKVNEGARLVVGNAGGLQVTWQGADAGVVGPLGQVRIVTVSSEGVSVASPVRNTPSSDGNESSRQNTR